MEANKKIERIPHEGAISGVCAGLAEYFGIDKTWIRAGFVLTMFFAVGGVGFLGPLLYIILWIVLPVRRTVSSQEFYNVDYRAASSNDITYDALARNDYEDTYSSGKRQAKDGNRRKQKSDNDRTAAGIFLLGLGIIFLLHQLDLFSWGDVMNYWPIVLILVGLVNIVTAFTGQNPKVKIPPAKHGTEPDAANDAVEESEREKGEMRNDSETPTNGNHE